MRLIHIVHKPLPDPDADAESIVNTAAALGARGHEMVLCVPRPPSAAPQDADTVAGYYGVRPTFHVLEMPLARDVHPFLLSFRHARTSLSHAVESQADAVLTTRLEIAWYGIKKGAPMVYDHYRPWGDQFPILRPALRKGMAHPLFLGALLHSGYAKSAFERIGVCPDRLVLALNGFDAARLAPRLDRKAARELLGLPQDEPLVVYTGRINGRKGLDMVLRMAPHVPKVRFLLVGAQGDHPIVRAAAAVPNVHILPWQAFQDVRPYVYAADVLLIPPSSAPLKKYGKTVLPMKTFLYLAAGRPILAPESPDTAGLLIDGVTARLVPPDDVQAAVQGLRTLLTDPRLRQRVAAGALRSSSTLTWDHRAAVIETHLERAVERAPGPGSPSVRSPIRL